MKQNSIFACGLVALVCLLPLSLVAADDPYTVEDLRGDVFDTTGDWVNNWGYIDLREIEVDIGPVTSTLCITVDESINEIPETVGVGFMAFLLPEDPETQNGTLFFSMAMMGESFAILGIGNLSGVLNSSDIWFDMDFDFLLDGTEIGEPTFSNNNKTVCIEESSDYFPEEVFDLVMFTFAGDLEDLEGFEGEGDGMPDLFMDIAPNSWVDTLYENGALWDEFDYDEFQEDEATGGPASQSETYQLVLYVILVIGLVGVLISYRVKAIKN